MFTLLAYTNAAVGVNAVNTDLTAIDPDFSVVNSHYIFTDPLQILMTTLIGASVTKGRYQSPKINAIGEFDIFAANRSASVPSNPVFDDYRDDPISLPQNEEFQVQVSGNLGAATERDSAFLWLGTPDWRAQTEKSVYDFITNANFTVTPTVGNWSGGQALTFNQKPLGGVYAINGMVVQGANALAARIITPRSRMYSGRKPRPGVLVQNAVGDVPPIQNRLHMKGLGVFGYFHTFEPPSIEVFGSAAVSTTYQVLLLLSYLGPDLGTLMGKIASNY